jgi:hypothetical protein
VAGHDQQTVSKKILHASRSSHVLRLHRKNLPEEKMQQLQKCFGNNVVNAVLESRASENQAQTAPEIQPVMSPTTIVKAIECMKEEQLVDQTDSHDIKGASVREMLNQLENLDQQTLTSIIVAYLFDPETTSDILLKLRDPIAWQASGLLFEEQNARDVTYAVYLSQYYIEQKFSEHITKTFEELVDGLSFIGKVILGTVVGGVGFGAVFAGFLSLLVSGPGVLPSALVGAGVGLTAALMALEYLGLIFLAGWIGVGIYGIAEAYAKFFSEAIFANGDKNKLEESAKLFEDAFALTLVFAMEGLLFYAMAKGSEAAMARFNNSTLGILLGKKAGRLKKILDAEIMKRAKQNFEKTHPKVAEEFLKIEQEAGKLRQPQQQSLEAKIETKPSETTEEVFRELGEELGMEKSGTYIPKKKRTSYPEFEGSVTLEKVAMQQIQSLEKQLGIPIMKNRVFEAAWVGKGRKGTSEGILRHADKFWKAFKDKFPDDYKLLGPGRTVTPELAKKYGWSQDIMGEKLVHHHLENGPYVVAIPDSLHRAKYGAIHRKPKIEATP